MRSYLNEFKSMFWISEISLPTEMTKEFQYVLDSIQGESGELSGERNGLLANFFHNFAGLASNLGTRPRSWNKFHQWNIEGRIHLQIPISQLKTYWRYFGNLNGTVKHFALF